MTFQSGRFRTVASSLSLTVLLLIPYGARSGGAAAQSDKFQEYTKSGEAALSQRKYEEAVESFRSALRSTEKMSAETSNLAIIQANYNLSRAYLGLGAFKNAIQSCDDALKHTSGNKAMEAQMRNQKGLAIVASVSKPGDLKLKDAEAEFRAVLAITDQDPMVSYNLGVTLLKMSRDAEGVHELQVFVARAGRIPEADAARRMIDEPRRARENFMPDFSFTTLDGEYITLKDLKGKVVLLDFWGSWCPPCRASTPSLVKYSKRHPADAFLMISIAVNEASEDGWRTYVGQNKMAWPQFLDSTRKMSSLLKVSAFPTYIIIDADGIIRDRRQGWNDETMTAIDNEVRRALKGPVAPTPVAGAKKDKG